MALGGGATAEGRASASRTSLAMDTSSFSCAASGGRARNAPVAAAVESRFRAMKALLDKTNKMVPGMPETGASMKFASGRGATYTSSALSPRPATGRLVTATLVQ